MRSGKRLISLRCLTFNQSLNSERAKNAVGAQETRLNGSNGVAMRYQHLLRFRAKGLSWKATLLLMTVRALKDVDVSTMLSHFGIQDESHWQVFNY